ncbi:MAG: CRISPR-associated protein Csm6 [Lachnospiraceae bacterium]|nr:CRISPR-associated protein Csm6 [Lachnospiraceae bacterium]
MKQTILFSPVGGTDPISNTNGRDGSLLHICRVYQPDKVILYMSKEILDNQAKDDRYRYCLDRLAQKQGRKMEYEIIERPNLSNVQEFDFFYQDFRRIIARITEMMEDDDRLLLNVSSGTPGMKSGLLVLQTLGEFPGRLIQVNTPVNQMNEHHHTGYDVAMLWEINEDNHDSFENRCREVQCPTLAAIKKEEIIKKHIAVYDYQAAISVARTLPEEYTAGYLTFLQMANARILLDFIKVDRILSKNDFFKFPVQGGDIRTDFEYALALEVKLKRHEYADFIRAITPLIVDLFEMVLKRRCKIDIRQYCFVDRNDIVKWDEKKLRETDVARQLNWGYEGGFKAGPVYSDHLRILIEAYAKEERLKKLAGELRDVEKHIRNLAAHQVVSITDGTIKKLTGLTGNQIMGKIKAMFTYTGIALKPEYWDSYDQMNQEILERMEKSQK